MFAQMSDSSEIGLITELARVNLYVGNLDIANEYYWQARQQADQILDYIRGMKIRAEIALLYLAQGHLDQALSENNIALQRARAMSDVPDTNRLTGNLGIILFHMGNLAEAKEYLEIDHANSKHQNQALAHNSAYLSRIYKSIGDHALAQDFAQIAVSISIEKGYRHLQVIAYRALAECSITTQDSQVYWKKALGLSQTLGLRFDEAACLLGLSVLELNSGEKENLWDTGIHLLELLGANGWINKLTPTDSLMLPFLS